MFLLVSVFLLFAGPKPLIAQEFVPLPPSALEQDIAGYKSNNPEASTDDIVKFANVTLRKTGYNYRFDICEMLPDQTPEIIPETNMAEFTLPLTTSEGRKQLFRIHSGFGDSPCGECFTSFPTAQVTEKQVIAVADGKQIRLERPEDFLLDGVYLVDEGLKKTLRTWELPFGTVPSGISADGAKLYLEYYSPPDDLRVLFLELTEDGRLNFVSKESAQFIESSEDIENFQKEEGNDYLSYKKFSENGKTFFIKFTFPCA